jgi:uncharacterized protein YccT (UPF0319 family)
MKVARITMLVLLALIVSACSSKIVKTYEGETLTLKDVSILVAGETIEIVSVNGKAMTKYLLKNLETSYGLKPGLNKVVFKYAEVWAKAPRGDEDARSELVASGPQLVEFEAAPGEAYRFEYDRVEDVRESRILAASFTASVVDQSNAVVGLSGIYDAEAVAAAEAETVAAVGASALTTSGAAMASQGNKLPTLDAMKVLWEKASADDKKTFLKWAFQ